MGFMGSMDLAEGLDGIFRPLLAVGIAVYDEAWTGIRDLYFNNLINIRLMVIW